MDLTVVVICSLALAAIVSTRFSNRFGVPALVLFVALGMFAGSSGPLGIEFDNYGLAYNIGLMSLAMILYSGGLETKMRLFRVAVAPAGMLATIGTAITMTIVGLFAWWLTPLDLITSMLLGAVISSTDAAAVFTSLKGRGLPARLRGVVEAESGSNDPVAILFTLAFASAATSGQLRTGPMVVGIIVQLALGAIVGVLLARLLAWLINKVRLESFGLYPILALAGGLFIYAVTNIVGGNGFLAVYFAGLVLANSRLAHRYSIASFMEAVAWGSQILMFIMLGLLVFPDRLVEILPVALAITAVVMLLARPIAVMGTLGILRLLSFGRYTFDPRERVLLSWAGLKGAVPIILAIVPLTLGVTGAEYIFNVIFVVVIVGTVIQGFTLGPLAQRLGIAVAEPPPSTLRLELGGEAPIGSSVTDVYLAAESRAVGSRIVDLKLPEDVVIAAVLRSGELVTPRGSTVFEAGDHVYLISSNSDAGTPTAFQPRPSPRTPARKAEEEVLGSPPDEEAEVEEVGVGGLDRSPVGPRGGEDAPADRQRDETSVEDEEPTPG
ncbi:MAG TPA: potassium/proton antiporter [Trueperaceae bacterium]|nr:potassium/proton antiporter [Trueperaceae bacterium]